VPALPEHPASRSQWRPELSPTPKGRRGSVPPKGAVSARPPEAVAFEREYPGASWLASRVIRELEVVGGFAETLIASVPRRYGLSHAALNALAVIEGNGEPIPVGEVGARMHITSGTMTSILDTLERNGYVKRLTDPGDRRRVLVEVTSKAQAVLDQMLPEVQQICALTLAAIDDKELEELLVTLARVREAIAAAPDDIGPPAPRRTPPRLRRF
jgi:DNA-binding MarR family transcriptional regulator